MKKINKITTGDGMEISGLDLFDTILVHSDDQHYDKMINFITGGESNKYLQTIGKETVLCVINITYDVELINFIHEMLLYIDSNVRYTISVNYIESGPVSFTVTVFGLSTEKYYIASIMLSLFGGHQDNKTMFFVDYREMSDVEMLLSVVHSVVRFLRSDIQVFVNILDNAIKEDRFYGDIKAPVLSYNVNSPQEGIFNIFNTEINIELGVEISIIEHIRHFLRYLYKKLGL